MISNQIKTICTISKITQKAAKRNLKQTLIIWTIYDYLNYVNFLRFVMFVKKVLQKSIVFRN